MTVFDDATVQELALPQGTIRYRDVGPAQPQAPAVFFVHGLLVNGLLWRNVVPALVDAGYRCVVPDLPLGGHTLPMPRDADLTPPAVAKLIGDAIAALGLEDVTLVGNDTGGAICQLVITDHRERITRLVLTNCDAYDNFLPPMFRPFQWLGHVPPLLNAALQPMRIGALHRLPIAFGMVAKHEIPREIRDAYLAGPLHDRAIRRDTAAFLRGIDKRYTNAAAASKFGGFSGPVLLAWAPEDKAFKIADAHRLAGDFADARVVEIDDSSTFVSEDQPQRLVDEMLAFLPAASLSASRS
jgi:pimeloyl-ACP methyl ester carboxylesterase